MGEVIFLIVEEKDLEFKVDKTGQKCRTISNEQACQRYIKRNLPWKNYDLIFLTFSNVKFLLENFIYC